MRESFTHIQFHPYRPAYDKHYPQRCYIPKQYNTIFILSVITMKISMN